MLFVLLFSEPFLGAARPQDTAADERPSYPATLAQGRRQWRQEASDHDPLTWVNNMVRYHHYRLDEVARVTGWTAERIEAVVQQANQQFDGPRFADTPDTLTVLPYPGGRHPRIGFLDGAIDPARETKVSIFLPWDTDSYVVADVPEAIWSQLGLTYLAHTHIPSLFDSDESPLPNQEWQVQWDTDSSPRPVVRRLENRRELPNGIVFGTTVVPLQDHVAFEMWLQNGSSEPLSDLRVQCCLMLGAADGFAQQSNDNKQFIDHYAVCRHADEDRWIIWSWTPIQRTWGNAPCPCLHADPQFEDCAAGETRFVRGWLSFYEGEDLPGELRRIDATRWPDRSLTDSQLATHPVAELKPLRQAHAHNDYHHERPLFDALDHGFCSVEADIFLEGDELLVGHDRSELRADRTLESLYLAPLAQRIRESGGAVWEAGVPFTLLIDLKTEGRATYLKLHDVLSQYAPILTRVKEGQVQRGAVTIVISGNRDWDTIAAAETRYAGVDGRLGDLDSDRPAHLMPMISDNWTSHFSWRGDGPIPADQRERLREVVRQAHQSGRIVRFWATPESEAVWEELRAAGADLINTDQLARLQEFLERQSNNPVQSPE